MHASSRRKPVGPHAKLILARTHMDLILTKYRLHGHLVKVEAPETIWAEI